ncbi:chemotaxis protein CheY [Acetobacter nitrogenifigens DSM 23921 = NBRC 105050]|uniref:Response regulator n=3 Tax=Acetobacter nitrogenifigens TaxID=285268 RepID=A0A511X900_9PROT|nr:chemotaxis protein CheY [Acetobacter nitrogenifigens DSM 23921 = NBRC 105050]GEN59423.1 response regulator [Acetobacter nitrogenifigens DSM 23921 = NBRC 105050]
MRDGKIFEIHRFMEIKKMSNIIVIVDDSRTIRNLLSKTLHAAGYTVRQAADGVEGVQLVKSLVEAPAAIITDLNMPRMDGYNFISKIRILELTKRTPILVLTTETSQDKKILARNAGATGWIVKPFTPEVLVRVVNRIIFEK